MNRYLLPLGLFVVLVAFLGVGLNLNPREVPSPLVQKAAPTFKAAQLHEPAKQLGPEDLRGQVWLLNVWASWCVACREEHPVLLEFAKANPATPLIGLNYKDQRADALGWLERFGDPYRLSVSDANGKIGIDYGVYGVPETFLIDKQGVIRFKQIGPVTQDVVRDKLLPMIRQLNGAGGSPPQALAPGAATARNGG
jgi:cytochrome c biogenesis protein CcmG/thiol:disulfide interchange protein DsbE